jgi:hypothetical protein
MNAFVYRAALLCEACGTCQAQKLDANGKPDTGDSDAYPQGPYPDGGGEADNPQHCDQCGIFLQNPLTDDGYHYVATARDSAVAREWRKFYKIRRRA